MGSIASAIESSPWVALGVFVVAAVLVWRSGTSLSRWTDLLADRMGLGEVFAGVVLLGVATSLPEVATTATAATRGAAQLAGSNLLGGLAMQIAILAVVDFFGVRDRALTFFAPSSALLMQGVMLIGMIALTAMAMVADPLVVGWVSGWSIVLGLGYFLSIYLIYKYEGNPRWEPLGEIAEAPKSADKLRAEQRSHYEDSSTLALVGRFALAAGGVLVGGYFVATSGEALAEQSGLGHSFIGASLVAIATSLPELSTVAGAVRLGAYGMAVSNILGTNTLELGLFLPADLLYREGPIYSELGDPEMFLAMLGILISAIYLWGVLERKDQTVGRLGIDSVAVLVTYLAGMTVVFFMS